MKVKELLALYPAEPLFQTLLHSLRQESLRLHLKGLSGALDTVLLAASLRELREPVLLVMDDKNEAELAANDLSNLLEGTIPIHLFPNSYKKPYQFEETENANILQRAEVLSALNQAGDAPLVVVTFPDALSEKVINKRSLVSHTLTIRVGDKLDMTFLSEVLAGYEFNRSDFVYEPGEFSIRGGIVDVFSYSGEKPFRIELMDDEVESIRVFDPDNQLSIEPRSVVTIVPNVQTRFLAEERESFLHFFPAQAQIWVRDLGLTGEILDKYFEKATDSFDKLKGEGLEVLTRPEQLFENGRSFREQLRRRKVVECGSRFSRAEAEVLTWESKSQPSFNKDFNLLAQTLEEFRHQGYRVLISSEQPRQLEKLQLIFDEISKELSFLPLYIPLRAGFEDRLLKLVAYTDHQLFDRFHRAKAKEKYSRSKALTLKELKTLRPGDFVTHIDHGVGRFAGLEKIEVNGHSQEVVRMVFRDDDFLFVSIHSLHKLSKYSGKEATPPALTKLGGVDWENKKKKAKKRLKDIGRELISLYAKRKAAPGFKYSRDSVLQAELETSFLYEDTPDQAKASADVKADMEKAMPMDRLVCGDVGFGKTEVAIRAAFKAVYDGKQVAVLVPTTILAMQHFKTFRERLHKFPCTIDYVNRFKPEKEIKATVDKLKEGKIDILIGTHRIVSQDVQFKDLGLMIIDEEQKFGVATKEKLKKLKVNVDSLTLSATPIPRTLQFSLLGARDLSIIATPPQNRQPVTTEVHNFEEAFIRDAVAFELKRGGQVFFVHNRVSDIEEMANLILRLVPDARIGMAHGQMDGAKLENVMLKFMEGEYDVLVSTNIIESGLDIPNANTIIINRANMFGLSDLHQMRGRVGRSNKKAYCYLLVNHLTALTTDARKRLQTLEEFSELGDGFKVAMRDLDIRGAGDMLGAEQSGFITDLGFDAYHKILDEAIAELKQEEFAELFAEELARNQKLVSDTIIETDLELLIPEWYVSNISERLSLYTQLDDIEEESQLEAFTQMLSDRFGVLPASVFDLIKTVRLRWAAQKLGMEKLTLKEKTMRGTFVPATRQDFYNSDLFGQVLRYVQVHSKNTRLKEVNQRVMLIVQGVASVDEAIGILQEMGQ